MFIDWNTNTCKELKLDIFREFIMDIDSYSFIWNLDCRFTVS